MLSMAGILFQLIAERLRWWQLALYSERGVKLPRIDAVTRIGLTLL
jgi:hypothetical protein